ncbi:MAG: transposase [Opitutaceae bacterium]|nr:transposase [Opitutaceae bacterium]
MPRVFPSKGRLYHHTPGWVPEGETFHVRVRCDRAQTPVLTDPALADRLLESVGQYHATRRWWCGLFLLMPDHWHALLAFPREPGMSQTVRQWKSFQARRHGVRWQDGYFDHRIRGKEELAVKWHYIRQNPVVKGWCAQKEDWPWFVELGE